MTVVTWERVTSADVVHAIQEYDRLGPEAFFSAHGFAPTTTYELVWDERRYPPKAILGAAYEFATGQLVDRMPSSPPWPPRSPGYSPVPIPACPRVRPARRNRDCGSEHRPDQGARHGHDPSSPDDH